MKLEDIKNIDVIPGLSLGTAQYLCENAVTCMCRLQHQSGVLLQMHGIVNRHEKVVWTTQYTDRLNRALADQEVATEHGAACISILAALDLTPYTIVERSRKKTGVDYWLANKDDILFQHAARLEVSGIFDAPGRVTSRINKKKQQTEQSAATQLPAYVSIVEFSEPSMYFIKK